MFKEGEPRHQIRLPQPAGQPQPYLPSFGSRAVTRAVQAEPAMTPNSEASGTLSSSLPKPIFLTEPCRVHALAEIVSRIVSHMSELLPQT
jgi:hypothetical protein